MLRIILRSVLVGFTVLTLAGLGHVFWPRTAHLRAFSPEAMGRLETAMWRDYYDHRYAALFAALYRVNRHQYGLSPWDSVRVAYFAAKAAKVFQPSRNRAEAKTAIPWLVRYYGVIQTRSHEPFDVGTAAEAELDWWQLRREDAAPEEYGKVVARVAEEVYGTHDEKLRQSARLRAAMMNYRDQRSDGRMRELDWRTIEDNLVRSFTLLKRAVERRS
jgi:hypothetical protein